MSLDLLGKVILVTGATDGIGKAAAHQFARRGATVVIAGRSKDKGLQVVEELRSATNNQSIELLVGDLTTVAGTKAVAAAFKAKHSKLDVLANNAGALFPGRALTADGVETTFALNHLSYFVLTHELLDALAASPDPRVVNTASNPPPSMGTIDFNDFVSRQSGKAAFPVYFASKVANVLFTREMAHRVKTQGIRVNCFNPGVVATKFLTQGDAVARVMRLLMRPFSRTPDKAAETLVWLATSSEAGKFSGEFFADKKVATTATPTTDPELARRLWALTEEVLARIETGNRPNRVLGEASA